MGAAEEDTKKMEELLGDWFYRKNSLPLTLRVTLDSGKKVRKAI